MKISLKSIVFLIVCLLFFAAQSRSQDSTEKMEEAPKTSFIVYFERQNIRENDSLWVEVLLSNESNFELTNVTIDINSPAFLHWYDVSSGKRLASNTLNLGSIAPHSNTKQKLTLRSDSNIKVGDFNVMFVFIHEWKANNSNRLIRRSITITEKPIKINLFGSESIAGIPLALAGFIVPGLVFWLIVGLFKVPWGVDLAIGDKVIYSVLISIAILTISTFIGRFSPSMNWSTNLDVRNGVGPEKLAWLAIAGTVVGLVVGGITKLVIYLWNQCQQKKTNELIINPDDTVDNIVLLEKILRLNPYKYPSTVTVRLKNNTHFIGYHYAQMADKIFLVGSFRLELQKFPDPIKKKLLKYKDKQDGQNQCLTNKDLAEILRLTRRAIKMNNTLQANGLLIPETTIREHSVTDEKIMTKPFLQWQSSDISVEIEQTEGSRRLIQL